MAVLGKFKGRLEIQEAGSGKRGTHFVREQRARSARELEPRSARAPHPSPSLFPFLSLFLFSFLSLFSFLFFGCSNDAPVNAPIDASKWEKPAGTSGGDTERTAAPTFSGDSAYDYVARQVAFGPRVPNSAEHRACGEWLASELERHGAQVTVQRGKVRAYDGTVLDMANIIGAFHPERNNRILLYAHWDTRPFADKDTVRQREPIDGANDGGSGVGVLLEVARHLNDVSLPENLGVDIIFFDAEDYGSPEWAQASSRGFRDWCLGSQFWANQPHEIGYNARFGILLDMVGSKDAIFNREGTSMAFAPSVVQKVWSAAERLGYGDLFSTNVTPETIDDNLFVSQLAGIPSANIVHYQVQVLPMGYGPYHHTHRDNMDIISRETLQAVGEVVMDVVWND